MAGDNANAASGATGAETGFTTDFGVASPGSPADAMGLDAPAPSGDVGGADPGAGQALEGDDQEHDRGIVEEAAGGATDSLKPRLMEDVEPQRSNLSGPTPFEEGRDGSRGT